MPPEWGLPLLVWGVLIVGTLFVVLVYINKKR